MVVMTEQNIDKFVWVNLKGVLCFADKRFVQTVPYGGYKLKEASEKRYMVGKHREVVMPKCLIQW